MHFAMSGELASKANCGDNGPAPELELHGGLAFDDGSSELHLANLGPGDKRFPAPQRCFALNDGLAWTGDAQTVRFESVGPGPSLNTAMVRKGSLLTESSPAVFMHFFCQGEAVGAVSGSSASSPALVETLAALQLANQSSRWVSWSGDDCAASSLGAHRRI
jgi:hypothetical protein